MTANKENIYIINSGNILVRIGLVILFLLILVFGWFSVSWQIGNLLADITSPNQPNAMISAQTAKRFSPNDPYTNWLIASVEKESDPEHTEGFVDVIRLSPNDYRWWIQLGRAYEQAEQTTEAEKAFQKAIEKAPNYTFPHWQLGNFYLRQNRDKEAFLELKQAASNNSIYREQIFSIAWDFYEGDTEKLEEIVGNTPEVRAGLAKFYAAKELPQKSLAMWNTLENDEKNNNEQVAKIITQALYDKRFLMSAVEFVNQLGIEKNAKAESVYNGGFEEDFGKTDDTFFGWKVVPTEKMRIRFSPIKKYEGKRSLQVSFNGFNKTEVNNLYQTIAVQPATSYKLNFWLKTENLKSAGTPKLEVLNANDNQIIASSESFPDGTNDWRQISIKFTVPKETEGIILRTARTYCGDKCSIFGTFWYDSFSLEKVSAE
jgi:tetratricopeptide (TPR) repeat protein